MSRNLSDLFSLIVPDNLQNNASAISKVIAFDDLGDFVEERERIRRKVEIALETEPKIDYSDFSAHVFFDSAVSKFAIAAKKILEQYPFAGTSEEKDLFTISCSYYENYVTDIWPRFAGYLNFSGTDQYVSVADTQSKLSLGSSSLYLAVNAQPNSLTSKQYLLEVMSGSAVQGYNFYISSASLALALYSGSTPLVISASLSSVQTLATSSFNSYAAIYDQNAQSVGLYFNSTRIASQSVSIGPINFITDNLYVGNSMFASGACFNGKFGDVRIMHTASELFHFKNFNRSVTSETYVKTYYKFNEGITQVSASDAKVIDYSKSQLHGAIANYNGSTRVSGAAIYQDDGDLILYDFHPSVIAFTASMEASASIYDAENRNYILRLIPETLLVEDQDSQGLLISFALAMARYFDELKVYVDQFDNLRITNYEDKNETPDLMLPMLKKYFGWKITDHFGDANPLAFFFGENVVSSGSLGTSLVEVRNQFWRRILNNLPYLYKTKGNRNNIDAFFNVLGIDSNLVNLKEFGFLNQSTVADELITKEKPMAFLAFGSGSAATVVNVPNFLSGANNPEWTIECVAQLPYAALPFGNPGTVGTVWQMYDAGGRGFSLQWKLNVAGASTGYLRFKDDSYQAYCITPALQIFDGQFVHVATTLKNATASLSVRKVNNGQFLIDTAVSTTSSGPLTSGSYSFCMGAGTGSYAVANAAGFYGQFRYWNRALSSSELHAHALNFENVGVNNPQIQQSSLRGHWPLNEFKAANSNGNIYVQDLSQLGNIGTGSNFVPYANPYQKTLTEYQFLSPTLDLKWTDNKIRVRNKTELTINDVANDTNQVTLEFNLVDALNEDIAKIFSTMDVFNQAVGSPINKYREDYADLEAMRRVYFARLSDSVNFTNFFKLFTWFDKKLAASIKQLLPARVNFIGGEFVVESHMLERNKFQHKYPVFHTPKDIQDGNIQPVKYFSGSVQRRFAYDAPLQGTYVATKFKDAQKYSQTGLNLPARNASVFVESQLSPRFIAQESEGHERINRNRDIFFPIKVSGDTNDTKNSSYDSSNFRNEWARRINAQNLANNMDGYRSGSFVAPQIGNGYVMKSLPSYTESEHGFTRYINLTARYFSGTRSSPFASSSFILSSSAITNLDSVFLSQSIWDGNNVAIDTASFAPTVFGTTLGVGQPRYDASLTFTVSPVSGTVFNSSNIQVYYNDNVNITSSIPGTFFQISGGMAYSFNYSFPSTLNASFDYGASSVGIKVLQDANTGLQNMYSISNVQISFWQKLTAYGVDFFANNQKYKKKTNIINRNLFTSVDQNILSHVNYTWMHMGPGYFDTSINYYHNTSAIGIVYDVKYDSSGTLFVCGNAQGKFAVGKYDTSNNFTMSFVASGSGVPYNPSAYCLCVAPNDQVLVGGYSGSSVCIYRSSDHGSSWSQVYSSGNKNNGTIGVVSIDYDTTGNLYAGIQCQYSGATSNNTLAWYVLKSQPNVYFASSSVSEFYTGSNNYTCYIGDLKVDRSNDYVYVCGTQNKPNVSQTSGVPLSGVLRLSTDRGGTWNTVSQSLPSSPTGYLSESWFSSLYIDDYNGKICVFGSTNLHFYIWSAAKSSSNFTASYICEDSSVIFPFTAGTQAGTYSWLIKFLYVPGYGYYTNLPNPNAYGNVLSVTTSPSLTGSAWTLVYNNTFPYGTYNYGLYYASGNLFIYGTAYGALLDKTSNLGVSIRQSIGPASLSPSLGYRTQELYVDNFPDVFRLCNVSEYPHYGGLFQMRNMILGTKTTGKIGKTDDSIVQIKYIGSVVQVMWPNQSMLDAPVQGFGELSIGQSPGKLSTTFTYGSLIDVTQYDHMALYCYYLKQASGTLDDIVIQINRRPLTSVGFAIDQSVEYSSSGSYMEARYKDLLHTKNVDYGDLTLPAGSYTIDIPLQNVREIRIGARFKNGQVDANQNFLVYGRFIKSNEET